MKLNKKYGIILVFVLLVGTVFLSACQSEVGARINKNLADNRQAVDMGRGMDSLSIFWDCSGGNVDRITKCDDAKGANDNIKDGCLVVSMDCKQA